MLLILKKLTLIWKSIPHHEADRNPGLVFGVRSDPRFREIHTTFIQPSFLTINLFLTIKEKRREVFSLSRVVHCSSDIVSWFFFCGGKKRQERCNTDAELYHGGQKCFCAISLNVGKEEANTFVVTQIAICLV